MTLPDYHLHTRFSADSQARHIDVAQAAQNCGVTDLCFTDHMDLGHPEAGFDKVPDFDAMRRAAMEAQEKLPKLRIRCGLEAGYLPCTAAQTAEVTCSGGLDYVILSTHIVDGVDCWMPEVTRGRDKMTLYRAYLEAVLRSLSDDNIREGYDCVGHIGYIAKCGHYSDNALPYELFPSLIDDILLAVIETGKGIEVNTSGLGMAGHVLPHPDIIHRYHELGGKIITVGSDAHTPQRVGENIGETVAIIKDAGFTEIALYAGRVPSFHPIE